MPPQVNLNCRKYAIDAYRVTVQRRLGRSLDLRLRTGQVLLYSQLAIIDDDNCVTNECFCGAGA